MPVPKKLDFVRTNTVNIHSNSNLKLRPGQFREGNSKINSILRSKPPTAKSNLRGLTEHIPKPNQVFSTAIILSKDSLKAPKNPTPRKNTCSPLTRPSAFNSKLQPADLKVPTRAISLPRKIEEDALSHSLPNYTILSILGRGAYATVRLCQNLKSGQKVAIKTYEKYQILDPIKKKNLQREIEILQKLDHPTIVKLYDTIDSKKYFHLIMEYINGCSLYNFIKSKKNYALDEQEAKRIFKQILSGIEYCHNLSVAHRDIKFDNILLDSKNNVKIIDFGFASLDSHEQKTRLFCGTPSYMAPEIVKRKDYCAVNADVWALGILLYAMLCGKMPFKGFNDKELYRKIERGSFVLPSNFQDSLKRLIHSMLELNPRKRPSIKVIKENEWVLSSHILRSTTQVIHTEVHESTSLDLGIISGIVFVM